MSHDPGSNATRLRDHDVAACRLVQAGACVLRTGTASWTDPTLTAKGVGFYPDGAKTAEDRLHHYASQFSMVEVDASYYALPTAANALLWVERTPDDFVFDVKAYAPLTGHPAETLRLPKVMKEALSGELQTKKRFYPEDLPMELRDEAWVRFRDAMYRLHGRRGDTWERGGVSTTEKYPYLYDAEELKPWAERVLKLAEEAQQIHIVFNNCYANYGTTNAREFAALIAGRA